MALPYVFPSILPFTELQKTIADHTRNRHIRYFSDRSPEISAPINEIAEAVESAYILTPKTDLPKVTSRGEDFTRIYRVEGVSNGLALPGEDTSAEARKRATAWLAIAQHLEAKEAARASEEAKAKAVADAAAATAKQARLNELADEWFGKDFADLGPNKAAAIQEIHRLETQLNTKDAA